MSNSFPATLPLLSTLTGIWSPLINLFWRLEELPEEPRPPETYPQNNLDTNSIYYLSMYPSNYAHTTSYPMHVTLKNVDGKPSSSGDCLVMSNSAISWTAASQVSLSFTISCSLLKLMSSESVMTSNHIALCSHLLLLPSISPRIRVFSNRFNPSHQVVKVLELQLQHQTFQWIFRIDFL